MIPSYINKEKNTFTIVILGSFNPPIFQPYWFYSQNLVAKAEADNANIEFITNDISIFTLNNNKFTIEKNKLAISSDQESCVPIIRDMCIGILSTLEHTPIAALGFNSDTIYNFQSSKTSEWHNLGHKLAPKEFWDQIFKDTGMRRLTIEGRRESDYCTANFNRTTISSFSKTNSNSVGVVVQCNQHYTLAEEKSTLTNRELIARATDIFNKEIIDFRDFANDFCDKLFTDLL